MAGNLKDMFLNLRPASDLEFRTGIDAPTLRIEGMTVAGRLKRAAILIYLASHVGCYAWPGLTKPGLRA